jgi:hypothetical protein
MTMLRRIVPLFGFAFTLTGCAQEVLPSSGQACVVGELVVLGVPLDYQVEVEFEGCIPTCGRSIETGCEVIIEGDEILIDAWVEATGKPDSSCGQCVQPTASCEWPSGLVGEYTVSYGDAIEQVELTAQDQRLCIDAQ